MADKDEAVHLLEELYNRSVTLGHRDDPLVSRVGTYLEGLKPKPKAEPAPAKPAGPMAPARKPTED